MVDKCFSNTFREIIRQSTMTSLKIAWITVWLLGYARMPGVAGACVLNPPIRLLEDQGQTNQNQPGQASKPVVLGSDIW
jgi:hypothetical protein